MNNKEPGYVYILTNPSFREDWVKICMVHVHVQIPCHPSTTADLSCRFRVLDKGGYRSAS